MNIADLENVILKPIGIVHTAETQMPRHHTRSDVEGTLEIDEQYLEGMRDIKAGDRLIVLFHFSQSPPFTPERLVQNPPHHDKAKGVFSICSPVRPNPIGMDIVEVMGVERNVIRARRLDMRDGTPILDVKPFFPDERDKDFTGNW